ncbi:MAG: hypothetical protein CL847_07325 [Crocinitomicaceae bacterium]|nr:hypothetical protein [Crocinitomicaceae bacterium]|tara:strand:- start:2288 stop:2476 length:189 start_codon:yes stop_codon:yes gene_type:complete
MNKTHKNKYNSKKTHKNNKMQKKPIKNIFSCEFMIVIREKKLNRKNSIDRIDIAIIKKHKFN